ncbi:MAG: YbbR-like domain-containing protein [Desulfovibrio sp.]|jgi:YbbR domain-containing protein|nr:YbbR-like domain-containing protein [Desulfovibrio sp.]
MKFSRRGRIASNLFSLVVAVLASISVWYMVSVRERREAQMDIIVDYFGIPADLVVTDGLVNKVTVRLRGPETLLRTFTRQRLVRAVNLSNIRKGATTVPLTSETLWQTVQSFEVVDIQPSRIVVQADRLVERNVPLRYVLDSPLRSDSLTVGEVGMDPSTVVLRGPEKIVAGISSLPVTITLDPRAAGSRVKESITLDTPDFVTAVPSAVQVQYAITSGRTTLSRRCRIALVTGNSRLYEVSPAEVTVFVEVPEALSKNSKYLNQLEVSAVPPQLAPGQKAKTDLRLRLPEGMTVLTPPDAVTVTRKGDAKTPVAN